MILEPDVEIAQLRKLLEIRTALIEELEDERDAALARAEAAEAEVAALKAQLAGQWRPVTEDEPPIGNRVILRHLPVIRLDADRWLNSDGIEFWHEDGAAVYWQPAPPQEANE